MSTHFPTTEAARASRQWWVIDATDMTLGRLATAAARLLSGKDKTTCTPFVDTGDYVVVVNCEKAVLSGRKEQRKVYRRHTGYPGGFREITAEKLRQRSPVHMVEEAIRGMLPKTRLGRAMGKKLKVHAGPQHPYQAQGPRPFEVPGARRVPRMGA